MKHDELIEAIEDLVAAKVAVLLNEAAVKVGYPQALPGYSRLSKFDCLSNAKARLSRALAAVSK